MMGTSVHVRYRPIRIGWCIRKGSLEDFNTALGLAHCFWGGAGMPVLQVGDGERPELCAEAFRVDGLFAASPDVRTKAFATSMPIDRFDRNESLFTSEGFPKLADLTIPLRALSSIRGPESETGLARPTLSTWSEADPLRYLLLACLGGLPTSPDNGYLRWLRGGAGLAPKVIGLSDGVPTGTGPQPTLSALTVHGLEWERPPAVNEACLYVGDATAVDDLVAFWNLRAAGLEIAFFDAAHVSRLVNGCQGYVNAAVAHREGRWRREPQIVVWSRVGAGWPGELTMPREALATLDVYSDDVWQGRVVPTAWVLDQETVLGLMDESRDGPTLSLQLPRPPLGPNVESMYAAFVASIETDDTLGADGTHTFRLPCRRDLSKFYSRALTFGTREVRAAPHGFDVVVTPTDTYQRFSAVKRVTLVQELLALGGLEATPSKPGRIATHLLRQMGGLQGCRVLKISGVRKLFRRFGPEESFARSAAMETIREFEEGREGFDRFRRLYIEPREGKQLTREEVLAYLVERRALRVGYRPTCPTCGEEFWISLEEMRTIVSCDLCGGDFNLAKRLRGSEWHYRRSGLLGLKNDQEGAVPVLLTLQQLNTVSGSAMLATGMTMVGAEGFDCEADLVGVAGRGYDSVEILIGECKSDGGTISGDDVTKLMTVAKQLQKAAFRVFLLFSKTGDFLGHEIEAIRSAGRAGGPRIIMLSRRELEPYWVYEETSRDYDIRSTASSFADLAEATERVFLEPVLRPRASAGPRNEGMFGG